MKTQRAYKFRFYPTQEQVEQLAKEFGCARFVYNRALLEKQYAYQQWGVHLSAQFDISKHITQYKKTEQYQWLNEVTAGCLTQKLIKAFDNFFKGRTKFPRFKKKDHAQSVRYALDQRYSAKNYRPSELLKLPKLGSLNRLCLQVQAELALHLALSITYLALPYFSNTIKFPISSWR